MENLFFLSPESRGKNNRIAIKINENFLGCPGGVSDGGENALKLNQNINNSIIYVSITLFRLLKPFSSPEVYRTCCIYEISIVTDFSPFPHMYAHIHIYIFHCWFPMAFHCLLDFTLSLSKGTQKINLFNVHWMFQNFLITLYLVRCACPATF